tara:strand:- start:462 stop:839 length:378 start_codon:yes stop_codon:yes gene_type:complete
MEVSELIKIGVTTSYVQERSDPKVGYYVFSYSIKVHNDGNKGVRLLRRYWHIRDEIGKIQEVTGEGVVGQKPVILPKQTFEYTSTAIISTETGTMHGNYEMEYLSGRKFNAPIGSFLLSIPHVIH